MTKLLILALVLLLCSFCCAAQTKVERFRTGSPYTYIFRISDKEAKAMYDLSTAVVGPSYFHTPVDSFTTNTYYGKQLPYGHYLYVHSSEADLVYSLQTVAQVAVKLLQVKPALAILVHDSLGNTITDAEVQVNCKKADFDEKTKTYRLRHNPKEGLVTVKWKGVLLYQTFEQEEGYYKRSFISKMTHFAPIYYFWRPFYDAYKSVRWQQPQGWVRRVFAVFDAQYSRSRNAGNYRGYLVTNKPMYQPGDTVKYKAFVVDKNGKPVHGKAQLKLYGYNVPAKKITEVAPYKEGAYEGYFILHDSLKLSLDRQYSISLHKIGKHEEEYLSGSFRYEDYELNENEYTLALEREEHQTGQENRVKVRGTNANGMNLLDTRVELVVTTALVLQSKQPQVFVPDTLWRHRQPLDAVGETNILLPDSIFPKASINYQVQASFLNSSNERTQKSQHARYNHTSGSLKITLLQDSLLVQYLEGSSSKHKEATLTANNADYDAITTEKLTLPSRVPLNPYASGYRVEAGDFFDDADLEQEEARFNLQTLRTTDSLYIAVQNPRKLPYWYFVYRGDKLVARGEGKEESYTFRQKANGAKPYFVAVHYVWAGAVHKKEEALPLRRHQLTIDLQTPQVVYPGQEASLKIAVTDTNGNPVEKVDLTAYAITSKFKEPNTPDLPSWDKYKPQKPVRRVTADEESLSGKKPLDWTYWSQRMGLDSIEYYNFLYPKAGFFTEHAFNADSITQVSPFVVDSGRVVPVHVIYLDEVPVYFSKTDALNAYAFAADSGYHTLELRTADKLITLDSLYLQHQKRLVVSADITAASNKFAHPANKLALTSEEQRKLFRYLFFVEKAYDEPTSYLKQGNKIQLLESIPRQSYFQRGEERLLVGPFSPDWMQYVRLNSFRTNFMMEPGYSYHFEPSLLKMREQPFPLHLGALPYWNKSDHSAVLLHQQVLTEHKISEAWEAAQRQYYLNKVYEKNRRHEIAAGMGRIGWQLGDEIKQRVNLVFLHTNGRPDSLQVYAPENSVLYNLKPDKYNLTLAFTNGDFVATVVNVKPNGQVQLYFGAADVKQASTESEYLRQLVETKIDSLRKTAKQTARELQQQLQTANATTYTYTNGLEQFTHAVSGVVTDKESGEPLPGVTVVVEGSNVGTTTDERGYYKLYAPAQGTLSFRFIGYTTLEEKIQRQSRINAMLELDFQQLQEVVVTGYGVQQHKYTVANTVATALQGTAAGVQIRSVSSISMKAEDAKPLIIVDGVPYSGSQGDIAGITSTKVLKGEEATALYGAVARAGVIIITTDKGKLMADFPLGANLDQPTQANSIRNNFSDYAIWQSRLVTNKQGEVSFTAKFPDDITSWNTFVLAMDHRRNSGIYSTNIKSFKAMMATLHLPRFLVEGDKAYVVGKALNYLPDSAVVTTTFEVGGKKAKEATRTLTRSLTDTVLITAPALAPDSVEVLYSLQKQGGMADGEKRYLSIFPKGVEETVGQFLPLYADTSFTLNFDPALGPVTLRTQSDLLQVMLDEIDHLHKYEYWCSEQAASKLMALLLEQRIRKQLGQEFEHERMVKKLVRHLEKTQLHNGAWTWWEQGPAYAWITSHASQALLMAKQEGYNPNYKEEELKDYLVYVLEGNHTFEKITALETLHQLKAEVDYPRYLKELSKQKHLNLEERLRLILLQQQHDLPVQLDTLQKYKQQTMLGGLYWGDKKWSLFNNNISNTLLAYKILRNLGNYERELAQIRAYLLSERGTGHWRNTYESARVLETLLPDLLQESAEKPTLAANKLAFAGAIAFEAKNYRADTTFVASQPLTVKKQGNLPVYLTAFQTIWNSEPKAADKDFVVKTSLKGIKEGAPLKAGAPMEMLVEVEVRADAEYVMVEVPIPASCSYGEKTGRGAYEEHREYRRSKVSIFCGKLPKGKHQYTIKLLPRYNGTFTINPAKAELMYFPTFYGRTGLKQVKVE
ncbi:carboxypeptidase-like regulatory domain-containing protein [Pontibacter russatus]|uniref:carboxypeptidase-like regulatory domain-containing protein n=1 Tax=Pontibacter russatus TaxID=2694929 RepID=UPI00137B3B31|nr:carboxypeptidase-like regulatory domain-containing protein [Pontibacter russatus]